MVLPEFHRRRWLTPALLALGLSCPTATRADEPLDVETYVQTVLRAHPGSRQVAAFENAARAERKAARQIPDPTVAFSWDRAQPAGLGPSATETAFSVSQTLPWPGRWSASANAGDRAAEVLRAEGTSARWELEIEARATFARLLYARGALEIARAAEADALALRDLTARRAELGESREVDRIKAQVEWLRQQRTRRAAERETEAAEAVLRTLAVELLPEPLLVQGELPEALPATNAGELHARLEQSNPRLSSARAAAARDEALASVARRGRIPDLDASYFHNDEFDKQTNGFSVLVRVPLWNANRGEIARAEATSALAGAAAERTRLELAAALERSRQELDVASAQAEILQREILPAARRSLDLARFSYQEGETSLLDLLDAQRTFRETEREAAASRLAVALALSEVQRLVGPDFSPGR
jgi:cobalt-zinc-cadmium efflux system outer membrane protein